MVCLERFDEVAKGCGSTLLERQLDFYLARFVAKDKDLHSSVLYICFSYLGSSGFLGLWVKLFGVFMGWFSFLLCMGSFGVSWVVIGFCV